MIVELINDGKLEADPFSNSLLCQARFFYLSATARQIFNRVSSPRAFKVRAHYLESVVMLFLTQTQKRNFKNIPKE
jgi:hypothetical protein